MGGILGREIRGYRAFMMGMMDDFYFCKLGSVSVYLIDGLLLPSERNIGNLRCWIYGYGSAWSDLLGGFLFSDGQRYIYDAQVLHAS